MPRHSRQLPTRRPAAGLAEAIAQYLRQQGFRPADADADANTWQSGGLMSNPQFVHFRVEPGHLHLQAWVRFLVFPGVAIGEYDLEGFFLTIQKRQLKKHIEAIERLAV